MKDKSLIVISPSKIDLKNFERFHFIIGVERGCLDLISKKINIDLSISDFDQVTKQELEIIKNNSKEFIKLNCQKDCLDGIEALNYLKQKQISDITIIVSPSKRIDMNLAIIDYVLNYNAKIINDDSLIIKLKKGINILESEKYLDYPLASIFSVWENKVTIKNMMYEVENKILKAFDSCAYSNKFLLNKQASIFVEKEAILILSK